MSIRLRVLFVEDWEDDVLLIVRELRRAGYDVSFRKVDTPEEMRNALSNEEWILFFRTTSCHILLQLKR